MNSQQLTKIFLRLLIGSIVVGALIGIAAIGIPSENWEYQFKILMTTGIVAGASVCGLACGGCMTRGHRVLPTAGLVLTGVSAALLLVGMWAEVNVHWYWMTSVSLVFFAIACSHLSMLFMANLAGGYWWAYLVAYQLILGRAALLAGGVVFEWFDRNDGYWRLTGVVAILVAAITLLIPVFHRFSREEVAAAQAEADPLFAVESEIAAAKKRLIELQNKRQMLLGRQPIETDEAPVRT
jgi:hypothetical protein